MAVWRTTTFKERVPGSPRLSFSEDGSTCVRVVTVPWATWPNAVQDFLGYATMVLNPSGPGSPDNAYISRVTPHYFPTVTQPSGLPGLYATKITEVKGVGFSNGRAAGSIKDYKDVALYDLAELTIVYETLTYDILDDTSPLIVSPTTGFPDESLLTRYITKIPSSTSQYLALSQGNFIWVTGPQAGTPVQFPPGKIITSWDLNFQWKGVPAEAVATQAVNPNLSPTVCWIDQAFGKVNATAFAGYDAGSLLLLAAPMTPHRSATLRRTYDINFLMKWFKPGHHKIFGLASSGPNRAGFVEISSDGAAHAINGSTPDGAHIYDVFEFSKLFKCPN